MASSITAPRTTRIRPADLEQLQQLARERRSTVSSVTAALIRQGLEAGS